MNRRAIALMMLLLAGCGEAGPQRAAVHGTVMVAGTPLERGVIQFIPVDGTTGPGAGAAIENGAFNLERAHGPVVGAARIEIRGFRKTGRQVTAIEGTVDEEVQIVPAQFNEHSTQTRAIQPGSNQLTFDLPGQ